MIVRLSTPAKAELDSALAFLRRESPQAAKKIQVAIERTIESLASLPNRGRIGQVPGTRELLVQGAPYVVAYAVTDKEIIVYRIRHTSQDPAPE